MLGHPHFRGAKRISHWFVNLVELLKLMLEGLCSTLVVGEIRGSHPSHW
jgi:hypothetical protein